MEETVSGTMEEGMEWIGVESDLYVAPTPVDAGSIRHFCELVEDSNPLYHEEDFAAKTRWEGLIAPPGSLMIWCMPPIWSPPNESRQQAPRLHRRVPLPGDTLVVSEVETQFAAPFRPGDTLAYRERVTEILPRRTKLGQGCFIKVEQAYELGDGAPIAKQLTTCFRYSR